MEIQNDHHGLLVVSLENCITSGMLYKSLHFYSLQVRAQFLKSFLQIKPIEILTMYLALKMGQAARLGFYFFFILATVPTIVKLLSRSSSAWRSIPYMVSQILLTACCLHIGIAQSVTIASHLVTYKFTLLSHFIQLCSLWTNNCRVQAYSLNLKA